MNVTFEPALSSEATDLAELRAIAMRDSLERIGRFDPDRARERLLSTFDAATTWHVVVDGRRERRVDVRVGALKQSASNRFYSRHGFEPTGEGEWDIYYVRRHRGT